MVDSDFIFFRNNWSVDVDWNFDRWHFNGDFNPPFYLHRSINIHWLVNVDRLFHYGWHLYCFYNLSWRFVAGLNCNFFLHLDIFGNFHNLLNNSFGSRYITRDFHDHFHRFLNNNFLDNLFGNMTGQFLHFILSLLQQSFCQIQINF